MIHILKTKSEFKPHMAVCHMEYNGGSANEENDSLVMKANKVGKGVHEILKSLGADESVLEKASYNNLRKMLGASLRERLEVEGEYSWVYVEDFDEEKVVFEHGDKLQSVSYSLNDNGIVLLGDDYQDVLRHDVYTSTSGEELILKGVEEADAEAVLEDVENSDINAEVEEDGIASNSDTDTSLDNENKEEDKEDTMSKPEDKNELLKSAEVQDIIEKAIAKDRAEQEAILKAAKIEADTAEVVKSLGAIDEADQPAIVKALVADEASAVVLIKAFTDMGAAVIKAKEEAEEIRKSFGEKEQTAEEAQVSETVDTTVVPDMTETIAKARAKLNSK